MHMVKCAVCGVSFDRDSVQAVKHGARRYAHHSCKPDGELVPMLTPLQKREVSPDRAKLDKYIMDYYHAENSRGVPPWVWMQLAKYKKELQLNDIEIYYALKYWIEIKKGSLLKNSLKIIFYNITEAAAYYQALSEIKQRVLTAEVQETPQRQITIHSPRTTVKQKELWNMEVGNGEIL